MPTLFFNIHYSKGEKNMENKLLRALGFNPFQQEYEAKVITVTPEIAKIILDNFNDNNRKFVPSQTNAIKKSVNTFGWLKDGGAIVFCTDGNIIEFQHRLQTIVDLNLTVQCILVLGADPNAFNRVAPAKNRTKADVINKKDKTATSDEVTALNQLLSRRRGEGNTTKGVDTLTMANAYDMWVLWKKEVRAGAKLTEEFFDGSVMQLDAWKRQVNAFAALSVHEGIGAKFRLFLDDLKLHYTMQEKCGLFDEMETYLARESVYMSGPQKATLMWYILCFTFDRYLQHGKYCQFGGNDIKLTHEYLVKKSIGSVYRRFLANPDGIDPKIDLIAA
jgi:hypothetical protein